MPRGKQLRYLWFLSVLPCLGLNIYVFGLSPLAWLIWVLPLVPMFLLMWVCHAIWQRVGSWPLRGLIFFMFFAIGITLPFFCFFMMIGSGSMAVADGGVTGRQLASQALGMALKFGVPIAVIWTVIAVWLMKALAEAKGSRTPQTAIACLSAIIFGIAFAFIPRSPRNLTDQDLAKYVEESLPKVRAIDRDIIIGIHRGMLVSVTTLCSQSKCPENPKKILIYNLGPDGCASISGVMKTFETTIYDRKVVQQFCIPGPVADKF